MKILLQKAIHWNGLSLNHYLIASEKRKNIQMSFIFD